MTNGPFSDEFIRQMAETLRETQRRQDHPGHHQPEVKELNARIERPPEDDTEHVTLYNRSGAVNVKMPRRGRLGDLRLCDADGKPLDAMPDRGEAVTGEKLLAKFIKVAHAFDRLGGYHGQD